MSEHSQEGVANLIASAVTQAIASVASSTLTEGFDAIKSADTARCLAVVEASEQRQAALEAEASVEILEAALEEQKRICADERTARNLADEVAKAASHAAELADRRAASLEIALDAERNRANALGKELVRERQARESVAARLAALQRQASIAARMAIRSAREAAAGFAAESSARADLDFVANTLTHALLETPLELCAGPLPLAASGLHPRVEGVVAPAGLGAGETGDTDLSEDLAEVVHAGTVNATTPLAGLAPTLAPPEDPPMSAPRDAHVHRAAEPPAPPPRQLADVPTDIPLDGPVTHVSALWPAAASRTQADEWEEASCGDWSSDGDGASDSLSEPPHAM